MKKTPKQIAAIVALILIALLIVCFVVSAFTANGIGSKLFFISFFLIIAVPILAWLFIFVYGRVKGTHTMAELFPKEWQANDSTIQKNPDNQDFSEDELVEAYENSKTNEK